MTQSIPYKVLIIDDEPSIIKMMSAILSRNGYTADTAKSGEEGLKKIQSNPYDCIVTDIKMAGLSGEAVLIYVKKHLSPTIPVIGVSGTPWLLGHQLFDAILSKPCNIDDLLNAIQQVISNQ